MPPDAGAHYYMARIDGRDAAAISSLPPGAPPQPMWNTYIRVESAGDAAARVREAGGRVLSEPFDVFESGRMGVFADPEGAVFCVWQPGSHRGSAAVNEHGAVNFNTCTPTMSRPHGPSTAPCSAGRRSTPGSPMWALPGYGDHLEQLNPGLRAGMKQMGAPDGFETSSRRSCPATAAQRAGASPSPSTTPTRPPRERASLEARSSPSRRMRHGCDSQSLPIPPARPLPPASSWRTTANLDSRGVG